MSEAKQISPVFQIVAVESLIVEHFINSFVVTSIESRGGLVSLNSALESESAAMDRFENRAKDKALFKNVFLFIIVLFP